MRMRESMLVGRLGHRSSERWTRSQSESLKYKHGDKHSLRLLSLITGYHPPCARKICSAPMIDSQHQDVRKCACIVAVAFCPFHHHPSWQIWVRS